MSLEDDDSGQKAKLSEEELRGYIKTQLPSQLPPSRLYTFSLLFIDVIGWGLVAFTVLSIIFVITAKHITSDNIMWTLRGIVSSLIFYVSRWRFKNKTTTPAPNQKSVLISGIIMLGVLALIYYAIQYK